MEEEENMRFVHKYPNGYRVRLTNTKSLYFGAAAYGTIGIAKTAALACRDQYLATGEFTRPPPLHRSKAEWARLLGVGYREFLDECAEGSVADAVANRGKAPRD